jgi:heat shock protein HtpX
MANVMRTGVLLAALTVLLMLIGGALGGQSGMMMAFVLSIVMNFGTYWFSDRIVLAMYRARPVDEASAPGLYRMVRNLVTRAGLPMPRVYIIPEEAPNAFATGRNPEHAAIAVTEGIVRVMSEDELEGVLAHELAHVQNRDTLIMAVAATLAGAVTYMAHMAQWAMIFGGGRRDSDEDDGGGGGLVGGLLMIVLAPLAATLIQLAISRSREFHADATGARIAGQPWGLAKALEKLEVVSKAVPMHATPATAHLFIVNPLTGGGWMTLFMTHPPVSERVARLRALAGFQAR